MPTTTVETIAAALPKFKSELLSLRKELAGIKNEAQTRLLIFDFMRSALGYETREAELEHDINGWKADIAIQPGSKTARVSRPTLIIECKCVTVPLLARHADQAARYARCRKTADGFLVFAGQPIVPDISPSARGTAIERRRIQLKAEGIVADDKFTRDYLFKTNSTAASFILGSATSGNATWKPA